MFNRKFWTALTFLGLCLSFTITSTSQAEPNAQKDQARMDFIKFIGTLDQNSVSHFMSIYTNYNIIKTVKTIRQDVSNAAQSCKEQNPEMKSDIDKRFNQWTQSIDPILEESQNFLNNKIIAQDYTPTDQIHDLLEQADAMRKHSRDKFKKIPVTSKEGCTFMLNKMDETQEELTGLLRSTLMASVPMDEDTILESPRPEEVEIEEEPQQTENAAE